jgi:SAM-dependent methyltransferase
MGFDVAAEAYDRFMGRYSRELSGRFLEHSGLAPGDRALDVGCGPGALTGPLVDLLGADHVTAIDPSEPFVVAVHRRFPGVDVQQGPAEALPFGDGVFDAALAQLVVHFMRDPVAGLREMARVTKPGGAVLASVWDHGGGRGPLSWFWKGVRDLDPHSKDESDLPGVREGELPSLATRAGLADVDAFELTVTVRHQTFEDWWEPYALGVGPAGDYVTKLDDDARETLAAHLRDVLPDPPLDVPATAWCVRGVVQRGAPAAQ